MSNRLLTEAIAHYNCELLRSDIDRNDRVLLHTIAYSLQRENRGIYETANR